MSLEHDENDRLRRSLLAIKRLQADLEQANRLVHDPVAIIGVGCRLPSGIDSPEGYWQLLQAQGVALGPVPPSRWSFERYGASAGRAGVTHDVLGSVGDVDGFDAAAFALAPREAECMDPQQRLLLEVTWEALDRAAIDRKSLLDSQGGVFLGMSWNDFAGRHLYSGDLGAIDSHLLTGAAFSTAVGRVSYLLGMRGPSLVVDTACSSSLVAVHLASDSLRRGESTLALAGGVSLSLHPGPSLGLSRVGALSTNGRVASFDAAADGYVRGEGAVVFVLKLLRHALRDGDPILGCVRGSAVNQDGRSNGMTAPNGPAQKAVIRAALAAGRTKPAEITLVEAHGTGTPLGDPIEAQALDEVLREGRAEQHPVWLGSAKPNIGHLEPAAGAAGMLKALLSLRHAEIPPLTNFRQGNSVIDWEQVCLRVPTSSIAWPTEQPRIAGVSSFGLSGTNAHVVIAQAPERARQVGDGPLVACLSASAPEGVQRVAAAFERELEAGMVDAAELCFTTQTRRTRGAFSLAVSGGDEQQLRAGLRAAALGQRQACAGAGASVVFVFPGQGAQWQGMAQQLARESEPFRRALDACDTALRNVGGPALYEELARSRDASRLDQTEIVQPVLFAVQVALARLLIHLGASPRSVVGHSLGEVAAAHIAGALTLEDAALVVCARSRLVTTVPGGAMALVELDAPEAASAVLGTGLVVAAHNGPRSTVLAGPRDELSAWVDRAAEGGLFCRMIGVDFASHSPAMDSLREPLLERLRPIAPSAVQTPMWSTVTGATVRGDELDGSYWFANLRRPVLLREALDALSADGDVVLLEIAPHPVLLPTLQERGSSRPSLVALTVQHRDHAAWPWLWDVLGRLWETGTAVDWAAAWRTAPRVVSLPPAPFTKQPLVRAWNESGRAQAAASPQETLLDRGISLPSGQVLFEALRGADLHALSEAHRVGGEALLPGAYALALLKDAVGARALWASNVVFREPLPWMEAATTHVLIQGDDAQGREAQLFTNDSGSVKAVHVTARLRCASSADERELPRGRPADSFGKAVAADELYARLSAVGLDYSARLRAVARMDVTENYARSHLDPSLLGRGRLAPVVALDAALQGLIVFWEGAGPLLPFAVDEVYLGDFLGRATSSEIRIIQRTASGLLGDVFVRGATGELLAYLRGLEARSLELPQWASDPGSHEVAWIPRSPAAAYRAPQAPLLLTDDAQTAAKLQQALEAAGSAGMCIELTHPGHVEHLLAAHGGTGPVVFVPAGHGDLIARTTSWCESIRRAAAQLLKGKLASGPAVCVVTQGLAEDASVSGEGAASQFVLAGLLRVLASEHPELASRRIDLPLSPREQSGPFVATLLRELSITDHETEVQLGDRGRRAARLRTRSPVAPRQSFVPRPDMTYLVTGGLGGLGRSLSEWLVEQGARSLILNGRSAPNAQAQAWIERARALGVSIDVALFDVGDHAALEACLARPGRRLDGVFHLAGVLEEAPFLGHDEGLFGRVLGAKVDGAWNLHRLTAAFPLSAFVLFSSASAQIGMPGQAAYAAANSFLDALAVLRSRAGLPATSIAWGAFADIGMVGERLASGRVSGAAGQGLRAELAWPKMSAAIASKSPHSILMELDVSQLRRAYPELAELPYWSEMWETESKPDAQSGALRGELSALHPARRAGQLRREILRHVSEVLRAEPAVVERARTLAELGLDSLMGLELRNRLETGLSLRLPASLLWRFGQIDQLVSYLLDELFSDGASHEGVRESPTADGARPRGDTDETVSNLPDRARLDELAAQLESELGADSD